MRTGTTNRLFAAVAASRRTNALEKIGLSFVQNRDCGTPTQLIRGQANGWSMWIAHKLPRDLKQVRSLLAHLLFLRAPGRREILKMLSRRGNPAVNRACAATATDVAG